MFASRPPHGEPGAGMGLAPATPVTGTARPSRPLDPIPVPVIRAEPSDTQVQQDWNMPPEGNLFMRLPIGKTILIGSAGLGKGRLMGSPRMPITARGRLSAVLPI